MKRSAAFLLAVTALFVLTADIASAQTKESRNVKDFEKISFGIAGNLNITVGPSFSLTIEGDPEYIKEIETTVRDGRLLIRQDNFRIFNNERANITVSLPLLSGLSLSGSGKAKIESSVKGDNLDLSVSGSGKIYTGSVEVKDLSCSISGSGDIIAEGKGAAVLGDISISGSGNYNGVSLNIGKLSVSVSGSGNCDCSASEELKARISGSGNIYYSGSPRLDVRASGSGHVRSK